MSELKTHSDMLGYVWHHMTYLYVWHDSFIRVTCRIHEWTQDPQRYVKVYVKSLIYMCDIIRSYVWQNSRPRAICWGMCDMTDLFICLTWLIHMCDMSHSWVNSRPTAICWGMCDMTHSYVWHDSLTCVTWLIHTCDTTHFHVQCDAFTCVARLIHMCDLTRV